MSNNKALIEAAKGLLDAAREPAIAPLKDFRNGYRTSGLAAPLNALQDAITAAEADTQPTVEELAFMLDKSLTAAEILDGQESPEADDVQYFLDTVKQARALLARVKP